MADDPIRFAAIGLNHNHIYGQARMLDAGAEHLFLVDGAGARYVDCSEKPLPSGRQLLHDIWNRTETAIPRRAASWQPGWRFRPRCRHSGSICQRRLPTREVTDPPHHGTRNRTMPKRRGTRTETERETIGRPVSVYERR